MIRIEYLKGSKSALVPALVRDEEIVCLIQSFTWWGGADVVTWRRFHYKQCFRRVYATGPIKIDFFSDDEMKQVTERSKGTQDGVKREIESLMIRIEREFSDVLSGEPLDLGELESFAFSPLLDEQCEIPCREFELALDYAKAGNGGGQVMGSGYVWRIIARTATESIDANSLSGRNPDFLNAATKLAELGRIGDLSARSEVLEALLQRCRASGVKIRGSRSAAM